MEVEKNITPKTIRHEYKFTKKEVTDILLAEIRKTHTIPKNTLFRLYLPCSFDQDVIVVSGDEEE